jgi:putative ABC transport system substrate-binding protein
VKRRVVIVAMTSAAVWPLLARAQQRGKVWRVGFIGVASRASAGHLYDAFVRGMRDLGYVEGKNLIIEWRFADGDYERLPALANELVNSNVDVILASSTPAITAAKRATTTIPIVMGVSADPVGAGLVKSLARPGGNVTGGASAVTDYSPERHAKRGAQALVVAPDGLFVQERRRIISLAAEHRIPVMYALREFVDAGGLISYGQNNVENYRLAASYVDKIFRGASPGDLPVEMIRKLELVINASTAKALGLPIPQDVLFLADRVIE